MNNEPDWLDRIFLQPWKNIFLWSIPLALVAAFLKNTPVAAKLATQLSFFGTILILIIQEKEASELKKELSNASQQVEKLADKAVFDHRNRGVTARLYARRKVVFQNIGKTIGFFMLTFGFVLSIG